MEETSCKVDDVIDRYKLTNTSGEYDTVDDHLVARWLGEDRFEAHGYRTLTEWFNKRLLKQVYDEHGRPTIGSRLNDEFETLTGEDYLSKQELTDDLHTEGIDVESILADMVSWSTMRHHLKDCLEETKDRDEATTDWERNSVEVARKQLHQKVERALQSYENKGELVEGTQADITTNIYLSCPECATRTTLREAVERGFICETHLSNRK